MNKKLKEEMEKITMADKTKERIIAACEEAARNRSIENNIDYTDLVSGVERIEPKSRIIRRISAIAACTLLVGGLGTTGVLLHKQKTVPSTEVEQTVTEVQTQITTEKQNTISPFGDFNTFEFSVDVGDGVSNKYDDVTQEKLADFLNNFDWGEEFPDANIPDSYAKDSYEKYYHFSWMIEDRVYTLMVVDAGLAGYNVSRLVAENGVGSVGEETRAFSIDFEAFDKRMKDILKDELIPETKDRILDKESPFTDIIETAYLVDAFDASAREVTDEKIEALIKTYNSQTWTECDCADKFVDFDFFKMTRDYFVVVGGDTDTNIILMTTNDGYACVYSETFPDSEGETEKSEKKYYTCNDTGFGEKLLDVYDPVVSDNVETGTQDSTDHNNIAALLNGNDCGGLVVWCNEDGGWCKQDFDQNQYETVKNYFNEHEVKEMVPNVYGMIEAKRWNDVFGLSQIQLYDEVNEEHTILYISKDSSMIAISRPSEDPYGDTIRIYKAEGLEALQFIRDFAE